MTAASATLRPTIVIGMDAAWGGFGACAAIKGRPLRTWHKVLPPGLKHRRITELLLFLTEIAAEVEALAEAHGAGVLVVVERPPDVYSRGNQAATAFGLGQLLGAIELWSALSSFGSTTWGPAVWLVPTVDHEHQGPGWRNWWLPGGHGGRRAGREAWKAWALSLVYQQGWDEHMLVAERRGEGATADAREDVAEAILIAVGASTRLHLCPVPRENTPPHGPGRSPRGASSSRVPRAPGPKDPCHPLPGARVTAARDR